MNRFRKKFESDVWPKRLLVFSESQLHAKNQEKSNGSILRKQRNRHGDR